MIKQNVALKSIVLLLILLVIAKSYPNPNRPVKAEDVYPATEVLNIEHIKLPPETSKAYSLRKNNSKFKAFLQYVTKYKKINPQIAKYPQARKEMVLCLALNMYHEARGSTIQDQQGVGYVTINRSKDEDQKGAVCDVVWRQSQFSWTIQSVSDIIPKETASWNKIQEMAIQIYTQQFSDYYYTYDITHNATHFYAPKLINTPVWARTRNIESKQSIGGHIYLKLSSN